VNETLPIPNPYLLTLAAIRREIFKETDGSVVFEVGGTLPMHVKKTLIIQCCGWLASLLTVCPGLGYKTLCCLVSVEFMSLALFLIGSKAGSWFLHSGF